MSAHCVKSPGTSKNGSLSNIGFMLLSVARHDRHIELKSAMSQFCFAIVVILTFRWLDLFGSNGAYDGVEKFLKINRISRNV